MASNHSPRPLSEAVDLPWLAFRYVAGELDAAAAEAFERRLDEDQAAREAVAEAVSLLTTVEAAVSLPAPAYRLRRRLTRWTLAATGLAAAAGLLIGISLLQGNRPRSSGPINERVVLTWSNLIQDETEEWLSVVDEHTIEPPPVVAVSSVPEAGETGDVFPAWLLEAASLPGDPSEDPRGS